MSNVAKLKKQAAEFELKKQFDKALVVYVKLLESFDQHAAELDVALFNRVGDLMLRQGNVADALDYYEQAVDHYAEGGFFNNAIALCNKILRHSPGRASVYYKLGKISAHKGFKTDAKHNFLEYADRMQKAGRTDEAFRALTEFADLCPDQDDIRLMLAEQLSKANRKGDAVDQLQTLYARYQAEGRIAEAAAALDRMRSIDPSVKPRSGSSSTLTAARDLIFIDLDDSPRPTPKAVRHVSPVAPVPPRGTPDDLPMIDIGELAADLGSRGPRVPDLVVNTVESSDEVDVRPMADLDPAVFEENSVEPVTPLPGVERIVIEDADLAAIDSLGEVDHHPEPVEIPATDLLLGLEPSDAGLASDDVPTEPVEGLEPSASLPVAETRLPTPPLDFLVREPDLDPEMASEPEPEGYLGEQLGARHTPIGSAGLTPSVSQPVADELPFISRTPSDPLEAISYPFGATGADDLLSAADVVEEEQSDELLIEEVVLEANASETAAGADQDEDADDEPIELPTPSFTRRATMVAVQSVETLKARIEAEPDNWSRHRDLAEAMLEAGDRAGGLRELATAMAGAERAADLGLASSIADEIARLEPDVVRNHQKRVEYAFRMNDRARLIDAYLSLGDALLRSGQDDKARTVYQRVLDLAPDDMRARAALDTLVAVESTPAVATPAHRTDGPADPPRRRAPLEPARRPDGSLDNNFVDLGRLLRDDRPKDLRMVVEEKAPTGDEAADFAEMLRKFKQGVAENVDAEDYQSHYDLAIAYKEMGLLDEAIAEFQKALAGPSNRLPTFEALGQCFLEKKQHKMASSILSRALTERDASEEKLIGVLYLLGRATEMQGRMDEALSYYQRVFVTDIEFRDIAERINALERVAR